MARSSFYSKMGRLSAIVMILPSSMAAGWILGYYLVDRWLGISPWASIVMTLIGAGVGFLEIFHILTKESKQSGESNGAGAPKSD